MAEHEHDITLTVNGERYRGRAEARKTLADFLREDCHLTGTHLGCEHGVCGACTILLDGEAVRSCLLFAIQADGAEHHDGGGLRRGRRHALDRPGGVPAGARVAVRLLHVRVSS